MCLNVGEWGQWGLALLSRLFLAEQNRCGNSHTLHCTSLHVCLLLGVSWVFFFFLTSLSFCHHLILKLERKGMEGRIANIRGFWKFPFYATWVFLKNSSLSVVFLWFWWQPLCPVLPLLYFGVLPALCRAPGDAGREDGDSHCLGEESPVWILFFFKLNPWT